MRNKEQFCSLIFRAISRAATVALAIAILFALTVLFTPSAQAQTYKVIYTFTDGADGSFPQAGLTMDKAGNLYGTTPFGGGRVGPCSSYGCGTVFKLSKKGSGWLFDPIYQFQGGNDGAGPTARVIFGPDGSLYGTTSGGGNGYGTVFNLKPPPTVCKTALCPWTETVLYRFTGGSDGFGLVGDLIFDQAGAIYGVAEFGGLLADCYGPGCGVVYKLAPSNGSWTETVLYSFTGGSDGGYPDGGVIFDNAGNLYGVASVGGASSCDSGYNSGCGTVYELTPSESGWTENTIFDFPVCCASYPIGGPIFDAYGNLYGAAGTANPYGQKFVPGSVYEIQKSNNNWIQVFELGLGNGIGGVDPPAGVTMDAAGNLYGVGDDDGYGQYGAGVVYEISPSNGSWTINYLHVFSGGNDGGGPKGIVLPDAKGNLYGTASEHGGCCGVVWEITP